MIKARNGFLFLLLVFYLPVLLIGQSTNNAPASKPAAASIATPAVSPPANPKTPKEYFARARQLSDLEAAGVPFHLKATFVATGDAEYTGNGTYEEWWQSKNVWRKEATLGSYKYVAVHNGTERAASATMVYTPLRVRQVEELQIFHIEIPPEKNASWIMSKVGNGPDAVAQVTNRRPCDSNYPKLKRFLCTQQYAFTRQGVLQFYRQDDLVERLNDYRPFGNLEFPREIAVSLRNKSLLSIDITELEPLTPEAHGWSDPKSMPDYGTRPAPIAHRRIKTTDDRKPIPTNLRQMKILYPKSALKRRRQGVVVIAITIDTTGKVREPYVLRSADVALDETALNAVRNYQYEPVLKNNQPALYEGEVQVDFYLNPSWFSW